jgi:hypothetical protein
VGTAPAAPPGGRPGFIFSTPAGTFAAASPGGCRPFVSGVAGSVPSRPTSLKRRPPGAREDGGGCLSARSSEYSMNQAALGSWESHGPFPKVGVRLRFGSPARHGLIPYLLRRRESNEASGEATACTAGEGNHQRRGTMSRVPISRPPNAMAISREAALPGSAAPLPSALWRKDPVRNWAAPSFIRWR